MLICVSTFNHVSRATRSGEASLALKKDEKSVPEFSPKDYEILTNER